jgi:hypothetical protein
MLPTHGQVSGFIDLSWRRKATDASTVYRAVCAGVYSGLTRQPKKALARRMVRRAGARAYKSI